MMKKVLFTWFLACSASVMQGATKVGDDYVPQRSDYKFRTEVTTTDDDGTVIYDKVITYLTDARNHVDTLQSEALPLDTDSWSEDSIGEVMEMDFNFDGIPDLQIGTGPMNAYGNYTYDVFIWNDQSHRFEHLDNQPPLFDPEINETQKEIVSVFRLGNDVEIVRYKWEGHQLVESSKETIDYSELADD